MSASDTLEARIQIGEELLEELASLTPVQGRRSDDVNRPEVVAVRDFMRKFLRWDIGNRSVLEELFPGQTERQAHYTGIEEPDRQLVISDFVSVKGQLLHAVTSKLDTLRLLDSLDDGVRPTPAPSTRPGRVFVGHGRSEVWRELKDFLVESLELSYDEFERSPAGGLPITQRLEDMLSEASFALLVMTADDEHQDGSRHARENVIHEAGLFQGRLGFRKTLLLVEEGCSEFSNVKGLVHLSFPKGRIRSTFQDVKRALEREGALEQTASVAG